MDLLRKKFARAILSLPKEHPEAKTGVHHFHGDNNELGTACGRYYRPALDTSLQVPGSSHSLELLGVSTMLSCVPLAHELSYSSATSRPWPVFEGVSCLSITDPGDSDIIRSLPGQVGHSGEQRTRSLCCTFKSMKPRPFLSLSGC